MEQLLEASEEVRPKSFLQSIVPIKPSELKEKAPEVEWLIDGILAVGSYGLITGGTGVGKSQLAIQISVALCKGMPWLHYATQKSRVLYCSLEMGFMELAYFSDKIIGGSPINEDTDTLLYLPVGEPISVLTDEGRNFYRQFVDDFDVFIFDTVSASTHLAMLDEATAVGIVAFFTELCNQRGKTIIALGHDIKSVGNDKRAESMYGHRLLMDRSSLVLRVEDIGDNALALSFPKIRLGKKPDTLVYERDIDTLWLSGGKAVETPAKVNRKEKQDDEELQIDNPFA